jgi:hypothetical protein
MNRRPDMSTHGRLPFSSIARGRRWLAEISGVIDVEQIAAAQPVDNLASLHAVQTYQK